MAISFYFEQVSKPFFLKPTKLRPWLKSIAAREDFSIKELNYIFLNDEELLKINIEFLNHNTYTDIITFDNADAASSVSKKIDSDIYISLERVEANAQKFKTTFEIELRRVMAHGLLHLCGYKDKSKEDAALMRQKEDESLALY